MNQWPGLAYVLDPSQLTGRPRERFYVSDMSRSEIDANALRRDAIAAGRSVACPNDLHVQWRDRDGDWWDATISIEVTLHRIYGGRWWLRCPRCGARRVKLYFNGRGPGCRGCMRLRYRAARR